MLEIFARRLAITALAAAFAAALLRSGPPALRAPETIVSNSPQRDDSREILLLRRIEPALPPEETVALVPRDPNLAEYDFLIALGQLPRQRVVSSRVVSTSPAGSPLPRFVATAADAFSDPRYRLVRRFAEGALFERIP